MCMELHKLDKCMRVYYVVHPFKDFVDIEFPESSWTTAGICESRSILIYDESDRTLLARVHCTLVFCPSFHMMIARPYSHRSLPFQLFFLVSFFCFLLCIVGITASIMKPYNLSDDISS